MSQKITIDPITRLEGHGKIEIFLDEKGKVTYVQLVKEVASEPNYEEVLKAVKGEACGCGGHH